jgi:hypothetical protein
MAKLGLWANDYCKYLATSLEVAIWFHLALKNTTSLEYIPNTLTMQLTLKHLCICQKTTYQNYSPIWLNLVMDDHFC